MAFVADPTCLGDDDSTHVIHPERGTPMTEVTIEDVMHRGHLDGSSPLRRWIGAVLTLLVIGDSAVGVWDHPGCGHLHRVPIDDRKEPCMPM